MNIVSFKEKSGQPKYKQIVNSIEKAIANNVLKKGDKLPSLNIIRDTHKVSRDTVLNAFNELKNRGIIHSIVGKGYYVLNENVEVSKKIFLLFDELNSFKEDLYAAFLENLSKEVEVDIYFHHFNSSIFNKLIDDNLGKYTHYIIMPANINNASFSISKLPKEKVFILDQTNNELKKYASIYQNFENDIHKGLFTALHKIRKYHKLILVFSSTKQPLGIKQGFINFCSQYNIESEILNSLKDNTTEKGDVYITLEDKDLIKVIKKIKENKLVISKDVGIISYNDTLLKEVVENGITTISTDFNYMGKRLAQMILDDERIVIENPSKLIFRKSI